MTTAGLGGFCRAMVLVGIAASLSGCLGTPSLNLGKFSTLGEEQSKPPTVQRLVDHIDCEMWQAWQHSQSSSNDTLRKLWRHLYENEFVVSIDMTVMLSHNQSVAPSATFTNPTDYRGGSLHVFRPAPPAAGTNGTQPTSSYSQSLAFSGQVNAVQDRNFDLQYSRKFNSLVDDMRANGDGDKLCHSLHTGGMSIEGNLQLEETINSGLLGIDQSNKNIAKRIPLTPESDETESTGKTDGIAPLKEVIVTGARATKPPTGGAAASSDAQFSTKIDFSLTLGGGFSPNMNTLWFKLGNGSSGGGGGGGGGSGGGGGGSGSGGGAGGGGGGGGSQMFNISRTSLDTLSLTFVANCRRVRQPQLSPPSLGKLNGSVTPMMTFNYLLNPDDPASMVRLTIKPFDTDGRLGAQTVSGVIFNNSKFAIIKGYALSNGQVVNLVAALKAPEDDTGGGSSNTGTNTFKIVLNIAPDGSISVGGPDSLSAGVDTLIGTANGNPKDYWDSLPECSEGRSKSLATSGQYQNLLLKLPTATRLAQ